MQLKTTYVYFGLTVSQQNMLEADPTEIVNHTCTFELRRSLPDPPREIVLIECKLKVKSVLDRIVPHCDDVDKKGKCS